VSVYSYTVNVDISVAAKDVSVDPLNIEEGSRDVKSATADVSLSVVSYAADVDTNSEWLASVDRDTLTLPTDQCRFLFDVSNPDCYPGAGGTLFDLSGNERNCEIRQLSTNADATGVSSNGPADDSGTLLDSFEASSDSIGSYVSLNKDKTVNTKYLRWQAPSDVPSSFTAFIVSAGANVADYAEEDDIDVELNDAILGKTDNLWFSSRGSGGYAHRNLHTYNRARFNYGASTDGVPDPQYAYYFFYRVGHTLYTIRDYYIYSQGRYILEDALYTDEFVARYANVGNDLFSMFPEPGGVGNGVQRASMAPAGPDVFSVTYEGNKARTYVNGKFVGERDVSSSRNDSSSGTWIKGVANNNDSTLRASAVQSGDIYAWGFYDRTFTEEEHLNIHKKFAQDVSPSKSVDLLNYPSYVQFNIADDIGKPDVTVDIPWNQEAIVNYDVNVDVSVKSFEASSEFITYRGPVLDLDSNSWIDGDTQWQDSSGNLSDFDAIGSPTKTSDGFIRINSSNYFTRQVVTVPDPLTTNLNDYIRDSFIPYDSSFTFEFVFRLDPTKDFRVAAESTGNLDNYKFFGYSNYWTTGGGGGINYGTSQTPRVLESGEKIANGLQINVYAGNNQNRGVPPYSARVNFNSFVATGDENFDLGVSDAGVPDGTVYYVQFVYDVENNRAQHYVNGVLIGEDIETLGVGFSGVNQSFIIGKNMQGGWTSAPGIDVKTLKVYDYAMNNTEVVGRYNQLQE